MGEAPGAAQRPLARSAISPAPPVEVRDGWEVSAAVSSSALRLGDLSPLTKVAVRAQPGGALASSLGVGAGSARRDARGVLVVGSGPGEWLMLGAPGSAATLVAEVEAAAGAEDSLASAIDVTHGRTLVRLAGGHAPDLLAKVCAIDLSERRTPDGAAFRSSVAKVVTDVVRDDLGAERSYLLHCERSSGQYLFDSLLDAGADFGIQVVGMLALESLALENKEH